jgi:dTDP-glucose 4,6-dehydratase
VYDAPVVVTGGGGLLGREVVPRLLAGGCRDIRVIDRRPGVGLGAPGVRHHVMDIRSDDLASAFAGARTLLHLAACQYHSPLARTTYGLPFAEINVNGTRRTLEAARRAGVATIVLVSTSMVYGLPRQVPVREDHPCRPLGPYGRSKLEAERLVESHHVEGTRTAIVRPPPLYGPGRTGVVSRLLDRILDGRPVLMVGDGRNRQELVAPADCARLVLLAGQGEPGFAIYNCGAASVPTMREWLTALIAEARSPSALVSLPGVLAKPGLALLEFARLSPLRREQYAIMDRDYVLDATAARGRLGWVPRHGGVEAALAMFRWYRETRGGQGGANGRHDPVR